MRRAALAALARREYSRAELAAKLAAKGYNPDAVRRLVDALVEQQLVSDERFAHSLVHVRTERGYGPVRIAAELRERGVEEALVRRLVDFNDARWLTQARRVRSRKYGGSVPDDYGARAKQMRFLHSRGFTIEQIRYAMGDDENP